MSKLVRNLLRTGILVAGLAQGVCAAGTWTKLPKPAIVSGTSSVECEVDSKGNIWFLTLGYGLFQQPADGGTPIHFPDIPLQDNVGPVYYTISNGGLYIDKNDSIFVGGLDGAVYGGKNGVFNPLPTIPLVHSCTSDEGILIPKKEVNDFEKDSQGRLIAITDSMSWWLNGNAWSPIGKMADYYTTSRPNNAKCSGQGYRALKMLDGKVGVVGFGGLSIIDNNLIVTTGDYFVGYYGPSIGPSGTVYYGEGAGSTELYYRNPPYLKEDTIDLSQPTDIPGAGTFDVMASFEDRDGWVQVPQYSRMLFLKDKKVQYVQKVPAFDGGIQPYKMLVSPDSSFWICDHTTLYKYSEKYSIPPEAIAALSNVHKPQALPNQHATVSRLGSDILVTLPSETLAVLNIANTKGVSAWRGSIQGAKQVSVPSGLWIVQVTINEMPAQYTTVFIP